MIRMRTVLDEFELNESISTFRFIQVQEKFPHDKLYLGLPLDEYDEMFCSRAPLQLSPSLRHRKVNHAVHEIEHSNSDGGVHGPDNGGRNFLTSPLVKRRHVQEGDVKLSTHNTSNDRYFILFNDLLLVAKHKNQQTLKLKERVRVSELWLSKCIDEVVPDQIVHNDNKSFVIGWPSIPSVHPPVCNYVASFSNAEAKETWQKALETTIAERKEEETDKDITVKVMNRINEDLGPQQSTLFNVNQKDDVETVMKMALAQFQCPNKDPSNYQLWLSCKEDSVCRLIGHEIPYAIKTNHTRNKFCHTLDENNNVVSAQDVADINLTTQFILKKKITSPDVNKNPYSWKKHIKTVSGSMHWGKRTQSWREKSLKGRSQYQLEVPLPPGKLFGNPLTQISTEEDVIPRPILDIMVLLFRKGPGLMGIFRKSGLAKAVKQLRQDLDAGKEIDISDKSTYVLATVLKEFFRSLPESLICSDIFSKLCSTKDIADSTERVEEVKRLLNSLPRENHQLLMHFLCLLHHIKRFSDRNNMNAYNLSVCVSPSIMKPPKDTTITQFEQTAGSCDVVTFLILNFVTIFTIENEYILGPETDIQFDDGPGDDSDSGTESSRGDLDLLLDDGDDSEKEFESVMPEIVFISPSSIESPFGHSDSSIGTNDSDDLRHSLNRQQNQHLKLTRSKSTPSSRLTYRREQEREMNSAPSAENLKHHSSDGSDYDVRPELLQQPTKILKNDFANRSTAQELIEQNKRRIGGLETSKKATVAGDVANKRTGGCFDHSGTYERNTLDNTTTIPSFSSFPNHATSESSAENVPSMLKKEVTTRHAQRFEAGTHTATECDALKADVVFHNVDKRNTPAAPSYNEHIQRTQSLRTPRATVHPPRQVVQQMQPVRQSVQPLHIAQAIRKPKLSKTTSVQRHSVEDYVPPPPTPERVANRKISSVLGNGILLPGVGMSQMNSIMNRKKSQASNMPKNFGSFVQNRKSKFQNRSRTVPEPFQNRKEMNNKCKMPIHHLQSIEEPLPKQVIAERLQNKNIENQVRDTMLATQTREDMLTTNKHVAGKDLTPKEACGVEDKENNKSSAYPSGMEVTTTRKCSESDTGKKSKQPRISITVMSSIRENSEKSKSQGNSCGSSSSSSSSGVGDVTSSDTILQSISGNSLPSTNAHLTREGRPSSTGFSSSNSPSRSNELSITSSKENTPVNAMVSATENKANILPTTSSTDHLESSELPNSCLNQKILTSQHLNTDRSEEKDPENVPKSPLESTSPFSLTLTLSDNTRTGHMHAADSSLNVQLTNAITKATKNDLLSISQLAHTQAGSDHVKTVGQKELRKTSRKLKSKFRTFGDEHVSTPREERRALDLAKSLGVGSSSKTLRSNKVNFNAPIGGVKRGYTSNKAGNITHNNHVTIQSNFKNTADKDKAYKQPDDELSPERILPQEESYV